MTSSAANVLLAVRVIARSSNCWRKPVKKHPGRRARLAAVARESERALREMIRRWQALPPERRTNFLRKRVRPGGSAR